VILRVVGDVLAPTLLPVAREDDRRRDARELRRDVDRAAFRGEALDREL
jgi:hypothetical protein